MGTVANIVKILTSYSLTIFFVEQYQFQKFKFQIIEMYYQFFIILLLFDNNNVLWE